jgi:hypothetical protein
MTDFLTFPAVVVQLFVWLLHHQHGKERSMRRALIAFLAALIAMTALSGCFVEGRPDYDHDRYEHHEHHDYDRDYDRGDYNRY